MPMPTDNQAINPTIVAGEPPADLMASVTAAIATAEPSLPADDPAALANKKTADDAAAAAEAEKAAKAADDEKTKAKPDDAKKDDATADDAAKKAADDAAAAKAGDKPDDKPDDAATKKAADDAAAKLEADAKKKPSDEFGELPKDVKAETRERFEAIKGKYDTVVAERDNAVETATRWHETIASTKATPEQFGTMLTVLRDVNSGTPEGLRAAYDDAMEFATTLAKALGLPTNDYDPLDSHPDLKKRVEDEDAPNPLTRADALEIAQARGQKALREVTTKTQSQEQQQQREQQDGLAKVTALGAQFRKDNAAEFNAKLPYLTPMIDSVIASLPPSQWVTAITDAYHKMPMPAAATVQQPKPRVPDPIRPGSGSGGGGGLDKSPGSALEAVELALSRGG